MQKYTYFCGAAFLTHDKVHPNFLTLGICENSTYKNFPGHLINYYTCNKCEMGTVEAENEIEAIIKIIKNSEFVQDSLIYKYYTDCAILEGMFCDPKKVCDDAINKFYEHLDEANLELEFYERLPYVSNTANMPNLSFEDRNKLITYYQNMEKYTELVSAFWGRSNKQLLSMNDECFQHLAKIELDAGLIKVRTIEELYHIE